MVINQEHSSVENPSLPRLSKSKRASGPRFCLHYASLQESLSAYGDLVSICVGFWAFLLLAGWLFAPSILKNPIAGPIPPGPLPAFLFFLSAGSLNLYTCRDSKRWVQTTAFFCASTVIVLALAAGTAPLIFIPKNFDQYIFRDFPGQFATLMDQPIAAANFFLLGSAILLCGSKSPRFHFLGQILALSSFVTPLFCLVSFGYCFGHANQIGWFQPLPLSCAVAFFFLSPAVLCIKPDSGLMGMLTAKNVGGVNARQLLPAALVIPIAVGAFRLLAHHRGQYDTPEGTALLVVSMVVLFVAVILWNTGSLSRLDKARQLAETFWKESEVRTRSIVNNAYDAFIAIDEQGIICDWNRQAESLFGWSREEALGRSMRDLLIPTRHLESYDRNLAATVTASEGSMLHKRMQMKARHRDGHEIACEIAIFQVAVEDDIRYCSFIQDISMRKMQEQKLQQSEERFRHLVQDVTDYAIIHLDPSGHVITWNDGAERIQGYRADEILGKHFATFLPPDQRKKGKSAKTLRTAQESGRCEEECFRIRKDGSSFWASTVMTTIKDDAGKLIGFTEVIKDLSKDKEAQDKIKELNEDLAKRLSELDKKNKQLELLTATLASARDQAVQASELKSKFVANMSHEIRTPISSIIGMTELMLDSPLNDEQRHFAEIINESSHSLLTIIGDILDFSKIEAGKIVLEATDFSVRDLISDCINMFSAQAKERDIAIENNIDPQIPEVVSADSTRLRQVLLNLISNAVKFTQEGKITLSLNLDSESKDSYLITFEVSDTGIGISEEHRKLLFEPFIQADSSTTRKHGGTGLGLSICKRLVELMGGVIGVKSQPNVGSKFWFTVPLAHATSSPLAKKPTREAKPAEIELADESTVVLIVEDNMVLRELALQQITRLGFIAHAVSSGAEALARLEKHNYSLILMDCQMPDLDGYEATREIRKREAETQSHTPIVAMTASAMHGDRDRCLESGMDDYMSKPVRIEQLRSVLNKWLPQAVMNTREARAQTCLDMETLKTTYGQEYIQKILPSFRNEVEGILSRLRQLVETKDGEQVSQLAHQLNGLTSSMTAREMNRISQDLEKSAKEENWPKAQENQELLEKSMDRLSDFLQQIV